MPDVRDIPAGELEQPFTSATTQPTILYIIQSFPTASSSAPVIGGAELQAQRVAQLLSRDFDMYVLTQRTAGQPEQEIVGDVRVSRVGMSATGGTKGALSVLSHFILAGIRHPSADIVQAFQLNAFALSAALIATVSRSKYAIKITGRSNLDRLAGKGGRVKLWMLQHVAGAIVAPSRSCALAAQATGFPAHKIHYIPNGVDTARFRPPDPASRNKIRAQLGYGPEDFVFCWIGRLDPLKGLDCMEPAWPRIQEQCPEARLLIVGDGAEEPIARRLAQAFPTSVQHLHFHDDVWPFYAAADGVLLTSRSEGLSNVLLEGLACGLIAVVSSVPENVEVGGGQDFLLTFDRESPASLVQALAQAIARRREYPALGQEARQHVERNYSLTRTAEQWSELYRSLL